MSSNPVDPGSPTFDNREEYPHVTQADPDRAQFRYGLKPLSDDGEIGRIKLAHSKKLKLILDAAEERIQVTGGIRHEDFWNRLDAEYEIVEGRSRETINRDTE